MELIVKETTFPEVIEFNFDEIKQEVSEKVHRYTTIVYTDDNIKNAKDDRAKLRKFVDALETKRKEIKKQCLAPYEAFEKQMKEIVSIVNEPIAMIDSRVKEYEELQKSEKREDIEAYWGSLAEENKIPEGITLLQIFNEKWLNASVSLKAVCAEIDARLEQIVKDLATLAEMPEFAFEATEVYRTTLDMNRAIGEGKKLLEMQKRKAEFDAAMQNIAKVAKNATESIQKISDAISQEKQWVSFRACLSPADAIALKEFFTARNIKFEAIK